MVRGYKYYSGVIATVEEMPKDVISRKYERRTDIFSRNSQFRKSGQWLFALEVLFRKLVFAKFLFFSEY